MALAQCMIIVLVCLLLKFIDKIGDVYCIPLAFIVASRNE